jgi:predicted Fe-Mo cluster-binding NifX family protein
MKIIITSRGNTLESDSDPRFGRGAYFMLIDVGSGAFEAIDNAAGVNADQGAGVQAGQTVAASGAVALLTGHVGPKAKAALDGTGIKIYSNISGTVQEVLDTFRSGSMTPDAEAGA